MCAVGLWLQNGNDFHGLMSRGAVQGPRSATYGSHQGAPPLRTASRTGVWAEEVDRRCHTNLPTLHPVTTMSIAIRRAWPRTSGRDNTTLHCDRSNSDYCPPVLFQNDLLRSCLGLRSRRMNNNFLTSKKGTRICALVGWICRSEGVSKETILASFLITLDIDHAWPR
jgi:hypothetical protein